VSNSTALCSIVDPMRMKNPDEADAKLRADANSANSHLLGSPHSSKRTCASSRSHAKRQVRRNEEKASSKNQTMLVVAPCAGGLSHLGLAGPPSMKTQLKKLAVKLEEGEIAVGAHFTNLDALPTQAGAKVAGSFFRC